MYSEQFLEIGHIRTGLQCKGVQEESGLILMPKSAILTSGFCPADISLRAILNVLALPSGRFKYYLANDVCACIRLGSLLEATGTKLGGLPFAVLGNKCSMLAWLSTLLAN